MEWMKLIGDSIQYIEERLDADLTVDDIARHIGISPFYYQKGFTMLCGFTVVEYIRNRRLALAGSEVLDSDCSILEIALKYGYDSPDSRPDVPAGAFGLGVQHLPLLNSGQLPL